MHPTDDIVTLALLAMIALLVVLPLISLVTWRVTRPPLPGVPFRWLCVAWTCLLVASSVWTLSRDPRFSVDEAGADNYVRLAFLALGVSVIAAIGAKYRFAFIREMGVGVLGIFSLFSLWGLSSSAWSVSPAGTLYKSFEYCAMLALVALATSLINLSAKDSRSRLSMLKSVFDFSWFLVLLLIVSVYVGVLVWPEYAILRNYRDAVGVVGFSIQGVLPGIAENAVGQLGAILGIVSVVRILHKPRSWMLYVPLFSVSLLTMVLSQSRSPVLAFLLGVIVVLFAGRQFGILLASGTFLVIALVAQYGQLAYDFMRRGQSEQDLASLTGRVTYWRASVEAVHERILNGYGANAGGRYVLQSVLGETEVSTVHSTWIEVLLDTGAVGLFLMVAGLGATWFCLFRLYRSAMQDPMSRLLWLESVSVLTVLCVRSVFSVNLVWSWNVLTFVAILIFIGVMRRQGVRRPHAGAPSAQPVPTTRWRRPSIYS